MSPRWLGEVVICQRGSLAMSEILLNFVMMTLEIFLAASTGSAIYRRTAGTQISSNQNVKNINYHQMLNIL